MFRCVAAALLAASFALGAHAQAHRSFPADALRGELLFSAPPEVVLNGQPARLAPGARIRGDDNLLKVPASLAGQKALVHYRREVGTGLLLDVWVLNAAERANRVWPTNEREARGWAFDPAGQLWSKP
jgi:hypothetical protein